MTKASAAAFLWSPSRPEPDWVGGWPLAGRLHLEVAYRLVASMAFGVEALPERFRTVLPALARAGTVAALGGAIATDLIDDLARFGPVQDVEAFTRGSVEILKRLLRASVGPGNAR